MTADDSEHFRDHARMKPRRFVDGEMVDIRIGPQVDIDERSVETGPTPHVVVLREIEHARDVG